MRIGIVTGEYPPMEGGVGAFTCILAQRLAGMSHEVHVLTGTSASMMSSKVGVSAVISRWSLPALRTIHDWIQERELDLINVQYQTAAFGMSPWIHFLPDLVRQVPIITTFHDLRFPYLFPKAGRLRPWIVRHLAHSSAGCIVTNHEDLAELAEMGRTRLIPIGSNVLQEIPADFDRSAWRARTGAASEDLVLAYFGLVNRSKGLDTLVECLLQLRQGGTPARLVIIGGGSGDNDRTNAEYATEIRGLIAYRKMDPFVHWTGHASEQEVAAFLKASDAVTLPFGDGASYRRGSLMAALYHGCAVISTEPRVPISNFRHGENLLLVPAHNPEALARAALTIWSDPHLAARLRAGARDLSRFFDWTAITQETARFFEQVVSGTA